VSPAVPNVESSVPFAFRRVIAKRIVPSFWPQPDARENPAVVLHIQTQAE